uniref:Uncharacterized protein n=1 Tax=Meloidogyne enterolobii TaxID=390850 RepID=A0A6V7XDS9_MELEN|nr:unnamed protein product [Meloidogyne enterolobii]
MTKKLRKWTVDLWEKWGDRFDSPYCLVNFSGTDLLALEKIKEKFPAFIYRIVNSIEDLKSKDFANKYTNDELGDFLFVDDLQLLWKEMIDELNSTYSVFIDLNFHIELLEKNYAAFLELLKNGEFDKNFRTKFFKDYQNEDALLIERMKKIFGNFSKSPLNVLIEEKNKKEKKTKQKNQKDY